MRKAECEAVIDQYIAGMKRLHAQMKEDQREIETMRTETDAILANIMQTLKAA